MYYIFLDIDGILNTENDWNSKTGFTDQDIKKAVPKEKRAWYDIFKISR